MVAMAQSFPAHPQIRSAPAAARRVVLVGGAGLFAIILLGALVLWIHYGTAVFFETIVSGLASCF
jgi:hypothetical protein